MAQKIIKYQVKKLLNDKDSQEKYLGILNIRIEENSKTSRKLFNIMLFIVCAFPLILETKISEISLGPFKLMDNSIAIGIIPTLFALTYYRYMTVWFDLNEQKELYKNLTSKYFNLGIESFLNEKLTPYAFVESIAKHHFNEKSKFLSLVVKALWIPIIFMMIIFPIGFIYYSVINLYKQFGLEDIIDWIIFLLPIFIQVLTILISIQSAKSSIEKNKYFAVVRNTTSSDGILK